MGSRTPIAHGTNEQAKYFTSQQRQYVRGTLAVSCRSVQGKSRVADLVLLSLQLCLGSNSRHVPGRNVIRAGVLDAVF